MHFIQVIYSLFRQGGKTAERNKNKIFLGGLPANCTETMIRDSFSNYGKVSYGIICN